MALSGSTGGEYAWPQPRFCGDYAWPATPVRPCCKREANRDLPTPTTPDEILNGQRAIFRLKQSGENCLSKLNVVFRFIVSTATDGAPHTPEELVAPTASTAFYDPQFSPDGETIFVHDDADSGLYAVDADTGDVTPLFRPAVAGECDTYNVVPFSRAADGTFE